MARPLRTHIAWPYQPPQGAVIRYKHTYCGFAFLYVDWDERIALPGDATCKQCQKGHARRERTRERIAAIQARRGAK